MESGGRLYCFDNVPQNEDSAGVTEAAHSSPTQHPMPDLAIPPVFAISQPAMEEEEDDPGWSTSETSGS